MKQLIGLALMACALAASAQLAVTPCCHSIVRSWAIESCAHG